jgi:hypothetical protein
MLGISAPEPKTYYSDPAFRRVRYRGAVSGFCLPRTKCICTCQNGDLTRVSIRLLQAPSSFREPRCTGVTKTLCCLHGAPMSVQLGLSAWSELPLADFDEALRANDVRARQAGPRLTLSKRHCAIHSCKRARDVNKLEQPAAAERRARRRSGGHYSQSTRQIGHEAQASC